MHSKSAPEPDYPFQPDVHAMLMLTPVTITIALLCCAFVVVVAYVAIDEQA